MTDTHTTVHDEIAGMIREVLDGYDPDALTITADTSFEQDLAFESIDLVVLGAKLTERYGAEVDIPGFLSTLTITEIMALRVGDLTRYVSARLGRS